jgi:hypothetical protein
MRRDAVSVLRRVLPLAAAVGRGLRTNGLSHDVAQQADLAQKLKRLFCGLGVE